MTRRTASGWWAACAEAIVTSFLALLVAVVAFFYGKKIMYGIKYPGMPYEVNADQLLEWGLLAAVAGAILGSVFCRIGARGRAGAIGSAFAIGLLAADAYRRAINCHGQAPVVIGFAAVAVAAVLVVEVRTSIGDELSRGLPPPAGVAALHHAWGDRSGA